MKLVKVFAIFILLSIALPVQAEEANQSYDEMLSKAKELADAGKYPQALAELSWAQNEFQKMHMEKIKSFFPKEVNGMKIGQIKAANAMGLMTIECTVTDTSGAPIKVALTGSATGDGAAQQGLGALGGLARMASLAGAANPGASVVRINNQRGQVIDERGRKKLTVGLKTGMLFSAEATKPTVTEDSLVMIAKATDFDGLNEYLEAN